MKTRTVAIILVVFSIVLTFMLATGSFTKLAQHSAAQQENTEDTKDRVVWQTVVGNIYIGTRLYYQSDEHYFGEVVDISDAHLFKDGSIQRAVLIRDPYGERAWYPRQTLRITFMTKAE